jgi:hypothetical protein
MRYLVEKHRRDTSSSRQLGGHSGAPSETMETPGMKPRICATSTVGQ